MKEIFVSIENSIKKIYLIENETIIERHEENVDLPMLEGNIYIGKVQNVLQGMQAAFVNIGTDKNAFIHLRDILPKRDITIKDLPKQEDDIRKLIKPGDPILVQVTRDKTSKKGARVSKHISLTGRFFVYMPNSPFIAVSQKIEDENKKEELKKSISEYLPENSGGVIRTSALNASKEELIADVKNLVSVIESIKKIELDGYPKQLYNAGGIFRKYLTDNADKGLDKIVLSSNELKNETLDILNFINKDIDIEINENYLKQYDYENQLKRIENRKVWLKCGGFITIDKTEALTAIDVNSGKFIGKDNFENTIFTVNEEATVEIAKQLRMRDIGGIIIIDYIDMHIPENKEKIIKLIEQEIKKDNSKVQIEGFTKLNLLELTRKHVYSN